MKINLNNYLMSSQQFLEYLSMKYDTALCEQDGDILSPYKHALTIAPESEVDYFWIFYKNYLDKSEIDHSHLDFDSISKDPVLTVTFIMAAQYYFL